MTPEQTKLLILALDFSISRIDGDIAQEMAELLEQLENTMSEPTAIEEIRKALEAMRGGIRDCLWTSTPAGFPDEYGYTVRTLVDEFDVVVDDCSDKEAAFYIAAVSPANMQELLDHLSALQAENDKFKDLLKSANSALVGWTGCDSWVWPDSAKASAMRFSKETMAEIDAAIGPKPPAPELFAGVNAALDGLAIRNTQEPQK